MAISGQWAVSKSDCVTSKQKHSKAKMRPSSSPSTAMGTSDIPKGDPVTSLGSCMTAWITAHLYLPTVAFHEQETNFYVLRHLDFEIVYFDAAELRLAWLIQIILVFVLNLGQIYIDVCTYITSYCTCICVLYVYIICIYMHTKTCIQFMYIFTHLYIYNRSTYMIYIIYTHICITHIQKYI